MMTIELRPIVTRDLTSSKFTSWWRELVVVDIKIKHFSKKNDDVTITTTLPAMSHDLLKHF